MWLVLFFLPSPFSFKFTVFFIYFSSPFQEPQEDAFQQELPDPRPEGEAGKVRGGKGGGGGVNIVMSKKSEKGVNKTCLKRLVDLIDSIFSVKRFKWIQRLQGLNGHIENIFEAWDHSGRSRANCADSVFEMGCKFGIQLTKEENWKDQKARLKFETDQKLGGGGLIAYVELTIFPFSKQRILTDRNISNFTIAVPLPGKSFQGCV